MMIYYLVLNIFGFLYMGIDKYKAIHHQYRIPERQLFLIILLGGMVGVLLGMILFHHKVRKSKFYVLILCALPMHLYIISNRDFLYNLYRKSDESGI